MIMTDEYLCCNYYNCSIPLIKGAWITRCSHVFCREHGENHFVKNSHTVKCPICNEIINRQTDVIKSNLNPPNLILACVRPEKALEFASKAARLWSYQMKIKRKNQLENITHKFDKMAFEATTQLQAENKEMKKYIHQLEGHVQKINNELEITKQRLKKYKTAYETYKAARYNFSQKREPFSFKPRPPHSLDFDGAHQHSNILHSSWFSNAS